MNERKPQSGFHVFRLERLISELESKAKIDLTDTGAPSLSLIDALDLCDVDFQELYHVSLAYPAVGGSQAVRESVTRMYTGVSPEHVMLTSGASEGNYLVASSITAPKKNVAAISPTYEQFSGVARNRGAEVFPMPLREVQAGIWALDMKAVQDLRGVNIDVIYIANPNNPTGHVLSRAEREAIVSLADFHGAMIVSDEVYIGTEFQPKVRATETFWGDYDRLVIVSSVSKSLAMPGLRAGWIVGSPELIRQCSLRREYTTITNCSVSDSILELVLKEGNRRKFIARTQDRLRRGYAVLQNEFETSNGLVSCACPQATGSLFCRVEGDLDVDDVVSKVLSEHGVLIVPGSVFGYQDYLRIGFGADERHLRLGLASLFEVLSRQQ